MSLMSTSEFAEHVGITPAEVRALISTGSIPADECSGRYVIDPEQVEAEAPAVWARLAEDVDEDDDSDDEEDSDELGDDETELDGEDE